MIVIWIGQWIETAPLWIVTAVLLGLMVLASFVGHSVRRYHDKNPPVDEKVARLMAGQEGYIVSAVLGLLALLTGFTFSLAVDRFETRRALVLEEANAIGTTYLRTQLLDAPHRSRISDLLVQYTDNRIALAAAQHNKEGEEVLARNDRLVTELWTATVAAFPTIRGLDFSTAYLDSMNALIDLDAARKASRAAKVPPAVFGVLAIYIIITAAVMGYVLVGPRGRVTGLFLFMLIVMAQLLIIDIDRPTAGKVTESPEPMLRLRETLATPPAVFDRMKETPVPTPLGTDGT